MTKATYKVSGAVPFQGHQPGEKFEASLDPELERRAIARGSIRKLRSTDQKEDQPDV